MQTCRIFFTKQAEAAYISHLDLQRVMARALRCSGIPVWYSQGFNPHIYLRFALALPLFQESLAESVDIKSEAETVDFSTYIGPLNAALPAGIRVLSIAPPVFDAARISAARYRFVCGGPAGMAHAVVSAYNGAQAVEVTQKRKRSEERVDLKKMLPQLELSGDNSWLATLPAGNEETINPAIIAQWIDDMKIAKKEITKIIRENILIKSGDNFV